MKKIAVIMFVITIISGVIGVVCKRSYINRTDLGYYQIGLFPDEMAAIMADRMETAIEESEYIIKVRCIGKEEFSFVLTYQPAVIEKVFKGKDLNAGDNINISKYSSYVFKTPPSINMGFVNTMEEGKEYLVFLNSKAESIEFGTEIYITADTTVAPVFSYDSHNNVIVDSISDTGLIAMYSDVAENEFFAESQKALDAFLKVKNDMINKYK